MVRPREVIRDINAIDPKRHFFWIAAMLGLIWMFEFALQADLGSKYNLPTILLMCLIFAFPYGYLALSLFTLITTWIARVFKGKASYYEIRSAVSWALFPRWIILTCWLVLMSTLQVDAFKMILPLNLAEYTYYISNFVSLIYAIILVWTWLSVLQTVGEVEGFSAWISLVVVILSAIILIGLSLLVGIFSSFFNGQGQ